MCHPHPPAVYQTSLEEEFRASPPHTTVEACCLEFRPSYSPNLNLIEPLWTFVRRDVLDGRHYDNFTEFRRAIDGCLDNIPTKQRLP